MLCMVIVSVCGKFLNKKNDEGIVITGSVNAIVSGDPPIVSVAIENEIVGNPILLTQKRIDTSKRTFCVKARIDKNGIYFINFDAIVSCYTPISKPYPFVRRFEFYAEPGDSLHMKAQG